MPTQRDRRIVQSEHAIIEAGIKVFTDNPIAGMSDVAAASGVGRTTLYRHFDSKEALVKAIALQCSEDIDEVLEPLHKLNGREAIKATFELLIPVANRYRFLNTLWPEVCDEPQIAKRAQRSSKEMEWLMDQAKKRGEIDIELPSVWLTTFFEMTLYTAWSLLESGDISTEQATTFATRSFFDGCANNDP